MLSLPALKTRFQAILRTHETESRHAQLSRPPGRLDTQVLWIFVLAAVVLTLLDYFGGSGDWKTIELFLRPFTDESEALANKIFLDPEFGRLARLAYWSGTTFIGYFLLPVLLIKLVLRQRLRDYGMPLPGTAAPFGIFLVLYLFMAPFVVTMAFTDSFQSTYPFYQQADRSLFDFFAWQLIYAAQFFALEFFYRGFLIHGLRHRFGVYSILISMIPYCMIHFGKPLPETLGSIVAGIALGAITYHYRSIWPAVAIHIAIAFSMDLFSLSAQGRIFAW
jgi:uncharacterized protein